MRALLDVGMRRLLPCRNRLLHVVVMSRGRTWVTISKGGGGARARGRNIGDGQIGYIGQSGSGEGLDMIQKGRNLRRDGQCRGDERGLLTRSMLRRPRTRWRFPPSLSGIPAAVRGPCTDALRRSYGGRWAGSSVCASGGGGGSGTR